jgi:hypothetical protein
MLNAFLQLLAGEQPDEIIWTADLNYWIAGEKAAGRANLDWDTETGYLELHRNLGVMPYYEYTRFWAGIAVYDAAISQNQETSDCDTITRICTPHGTLEEHSTWLEASSSTGITRHYVQNENELDIFLKLLEHRRLEPAIQDDDCTRRALWASFDGMPSLGLPRSPLAAFIYEWAGIDHTAYLLADCPDKVQAALRLLDEQESPIIDAVCQQRPPLVHFPENMSSDNMAGLYRTYLEPVYQKRLDKLHAAGIKTAVHLDGRVKGLLPMLVQTGFDSIESLTPKPAGDLDLAEINHLAGSDQVILWGGVPGVLFAPPYTWEDMKSHVTQVIRTWGHRPFILGVADQVPPDGDITFVPRIADLLERL